jgi:hypothetical protein
LYHKADSRRVPRQTGRLLASAAVAVAVATVFAACGGVQHSVVVRVGQVAITRATVEHWMSATAGGQVSADPRKRQALRRQTISFLISSQWLLGEATADHLRITQAEIDGQLAKTKKVSFPGGAAELHEFLKTTGQSLADLILEAKAELAAAKIRQMLASREPAITPAQLASYYKYNKQRFVVPERRTIEITNRNSKAEALAIKHEVASGVSFASIAQRHWTLELPPFVYSVARGSDGKLVRAIHAARPHVLTGPAYQHFDYFIFEVTQVTPRREKTLAEVRDLISKKLTTENRRRTLAAFIAAWKQRWTARTDCHADYIVPQCRQSRNAEPPQNPLSFG